MLRLRNLLFLVAWLATTGLLSYEVVQKSPQTPLGPLPGSAVASFADRAVKWEPATGITPLDMLLHESREACIYYRGLALGRLR